MENLFTRRFTDVVRTGCLNWISSDTFYINFDRYIMFLELDPLSTQKMDFPLKASAVFTQPGALSHLAEDAKAIDAPASAEYCQFDYRRHFRSLNHEAFVASTDILLDSVMFPPRSAVSDREHFVKAVPLGRSLNNHVRVLGVTNDGHLMLYTQPSIGTWVLNDSLTQMIVDYLARNKKFISHCSPSHDWTSGAKKDERFVELITMYHAISFISVRNLVRVPVDDQSDVIFTLQRSNHILCWKSATKNGMETISIQNQFLAHNTQLVSAINCLMIDQHVGLVFIGLVDGTLQMRTFTVTESTIKIELENFHVVREPNNNSLTVLDSHINSETDSAAAVVVVNLIAVWTFEVQILQLTIERQGNVSSNTVAYSVQHTVRAVVPFQSAFPVGGCSIRDNTLLVWAPDEIALFDVKFEQQTISIAPKVSQLSAASPVKLSDVEVVGATTSKHALFIIYVLRSRRSHDTYVLGRTQLFIDALLPTKTVFEQLCVSKSSCSQLLDYLTFLRRYSHSMEAGEILTFAENIDISSAVFSMQLVRALLLIRARSLEQGRKSVTKAAEQIAYTERVLMARRAEQLVLASLDENYRNEHRSTEEASEAKIQHENEMFATAVDIVTRFWLDNGGKGPPDDALITGETLQLAAAAFDAEVVPRPTCPFCSALEFQSLPGASGDRLAKDESECTELEPPSSPPPVAIWMCANRHKFNRCSLTCLPIVGNSWQRCSTCSAIALSSQDLTDLTNLLPLAEKWCHFCGGTFVEST